MVRWILFGLLLFNGLTAVIAGAMLAYMPDGHLLQLSLGLLEHSPFTDYRIPGLMLFSVIGIGSLVAAYLVWRPQQRTGRFAQVAGVALVIWIMVQMLMLRTVLPIHLIYLAVGLAIVGLAEHLRRST